MYRLLTSIEHGRSWDCFSDVSSTRKVTTRILTLEVKLWQPNELTEFVPNRPQLQSASSGRPLGLMRTDLSPHSQAAPRFRNLAALISFTLHRRS